MYGKFQEHLQKELNEIKEAGLYKQERLIEGPQKAAINVKGQEVLNFCANNYLGLSNHPRHADSLPLPHRPVGFHEPDNNLQR